MANTLRRVGERHRVVIERLGRYDRTLLPGLHLVIPELDKEKIEIFIGNEKLPLFTKGEKIDFTDGSAAPRGVFFTIRTKSPDTPYDTARCKEQTGVYRTVYSYSNQEERRQNIINRVEAVLSGYLDKLSISEALDKKGLNLTAEIENQNGDMWRTLVDDLAEWGVETEVISISDFDLPSDITEARGAGARQKGELDAAIFNARKDAVLLMGTQLEMDAEARGITVIQLKKKIAKDPALQEHYRQVSSDLMRRKMATNKVFFDAPGGTSLESVFSILSGVLGGGRGSGSGSGNDARDNEDGSLNDPIMKRMKKNRGV